MPSAFPPAVDSEAAATVAAHGRRCFAAEAQRWDQRDVPFVTIDPPGSRDLDQAFFAERRRSGYRVRYAIADVAAFVSPGSVVDDEAWRRGQSVYMPDGKAPLYPVVVSEEAASLLPDSDRPALLWTIELDQGAEVVESRLDRAVVRSRRALTYSSVQSAFDADEADEPLLLLREVGRLLQEREKERDGISLNLPKRELAATSGGYLFRYEPVLPVEGWNAQISLLAGHCGADIMIDGGIGILRTLPPVDARSVGTLERVATALGIDWPKGASLGSVVRAQDPSTPEGAAFLTQASHALRGAGYTPVTRDGEAALHGGLRMTYAHVTAPLRRLVDRYANEVVVALCADRPVPVWAAAALARLPEAMTEADNRADAVEAGVLNLAEAVVLARHVGQTFRAVVVERDEDRATILLRDPPVIAKMPDSARELGDTVDVRLLDADPTQRRLKFELA